MADSRMELWRKERLKRSPWPRVLPPAGTGAACLVLLRFLPPEGTDYAGLVDNLLFVLLGVSLFIFLLILVPVLIFTIRYHTEWNYKPGARIRGYLPLELSWATMGFVIALFIGWHSLQDVEMESNVPKDAMVVNVIGRRFFWTFQYPEQGISSTGDMPLPIGRPVRLQITSGDVVHSFWVPAFRLKRDALPGMVTRLWFTPTELGSYDARCAELCGLGHYSMTATVRVVSEADFNDWVEKQQQQ